jgi:hypothetical protein
MATIASINPFPHDVYTAFEAYISSPSYKALGTICPWKYLVFVDE